MTPIITKLTKDNEEYTGLHFDGTPRAHIFDEFGALVDSFELHPIYDAVIGDWFQDAFTPVDYDFYGYTRVDSNVRIETEQHDVF